MRLMPSVRGALNGLLLGLNTLLAFALMVPPALVKLLVPADRVRAGCDRALNALAGGWVAVNNAWIAGACPAPWQVRGVEGLNARGWYLVSSNHQSWVDILVLQRIFHGRIPFLKFFLKRELIWVPVIGLAWWALDFPFMKRGRGTARGDLATTRRSCEKFKRVPTAVINFVEGTRFTAAKHAAQNSSYRHLLEPRSGGLGVALATMGGQFEAMLDVTIVYPEGTPSFWALLSGDVRAVAVDVRQRAIPPHLLGTSPSGDKARRAHTRKWIEAQWQDKDRLIQERLAARRGARK
ncbi:1-acyl-sn-glycerol-3-phosphate acyltransferase [Variovorax paradoxus]|uniref:1-acyl-sn-glycerol-3-phosphate acyltransferase n=2 Tax=Variovorax paradoxus TaxID=34073 RepID=A0AAW8EHZ7_VARPD|nr:acyltransferase [Variovorax paradoxus]MDP9972055.1 1-acyl-sn-glycerol-3-phosphate acyltransferase [Variovorax paradoxus]